MTSDRGGIVAIAAVDAAYNPALIEVPMQEELAFSEWEEARDAFDDGPRFAVAHKVNNIGRAQCATFTTHKEEAGYVMEWGAGTLMLCWHCYPRG